MQLRFKILIFYHFSTKYYGMNYKNFKKLIFNN